MEQSTEKESHSKKENASYCTGDQVQENLGTVGTRWEILQSDFLLLVKYRICGQIPYTI